MGRNKVNNMNKSQEIINSYNEENSSIDNLGETPKGVINPLQKKKKKKKKDQIKNTIKKYEKYIDTYGAYVVANKRMGSGGIQLEEGMRSFAFITDIPSSNTYEITITNDKANGVFKYENKEEAEKDWEIN